MKRLVLPTIFIFVAIGTLLAPPAKKSPPPNYKNWNTKWFATCQGESFVVDVKVGGSKSKQGQSTRSFEAQFFPGGGQCTIGADAPRDRDIFIQGTVSGTTIKGTINLCTTSQVLVDANQLSAVFQGEFEATFDPQFGVISGTYKVEHYKKTDDKSDTSSTAEPSAAAKPYERDQKNDPTVQFDMHVFRGAPYDQVTRHETNPQPTPTPDPLQGPKNRIDSFFKMLADSLIFYDTHNVPEGGKE